MFDTDINSGFTSSGDINISDRFTEITLLHSSKNGYSEVYKAKRFGQWHVLKCLTKEAAKDLTYQTLLEKEFRIAYPLSHPSIVRTLGIEKVDSIGTCIIQEYIDGEPITSITREQAVELCDAVEYIHQAGVIHRDIKPENILVRKDNGHIVLIDFGLADKADFSVLKGGAGTTGYAAPEQWKGESSPAVDIYGIGGVIKMNSSLHRIAEKCQRTDPKKRYQSARELKRTLTRKFPINAIIIAFLMMLLLGGVVYTYTQMRTAGHTIHATSSQIDTVLQENNALHISITNMRHENDSLYARIHSIEEQNEQVNAQLINIQQQYIQLSRENETYRRMFREQEYRQRVDVQRE